MGKSGVGIVATSGRGSEIKRALVVVGNAVSIPNASGLYFGVQVEYNKSRLRTTISVEYACMSEILAKGSRASNVRR